MELELSGKSALVTGSSRGIGRAIAEVLCAEGCRVAVNARKLNDLNSCAEAIGAEAIVVGDVSNATEANQVVRGVSKAFGGLDILVCNVGSGSSVAPGEETNEEWQRVFALNLWSTTNVVEAAKNLLETSKGVVVCISSICGHEVVPGAPVTYSAAKAALHAYVRGIARPLGEMGVRINAVAPGNILFDGSVWSRKLAENEEAVKSLLKKDVALQGLGKPQDVAELVAFLASPRTAFASGSVWTLDGGQIHS
jgi:NAD(P)-dependent dehydrogenase (short-subunit alcohol dehydrogenase family)